ncbi:hypothetical protein DMC30DRAFT_43545 [Rhodotorula diobovata]|uniref:Uncharacterized protein n=1 Tax=Rhodotorula diobovata TaxID=5288 RepID=A0A5C5FPT9_9BASI|nr:hypothetical protein DMC30DRAFT_43545 [Rhodotorula diobovata]
MPDRPHPVERVSSGGKTDATSATAGDERHSTSSLAAEPPRPAVPPLACMRLSPRPCVNQKLVDALAPLREWRIKEYGPNSPEAISYATAVSAIIACPYKSVRSSPSRWTSFSRRGT